MLNLLIKYAYDHALEAEPGFKPKTARWAISFASDGRYLGVLDFERNGRTFAKCPDLSQPELKFLGRKPVGAGKDDKAFGSQFLLAECQNVVLFEKPEQPASPEVQIKHRFFLSLLQKAGTVTPTLDLVAKALSDPEVISAIHTDLTQKKATPLDKITIQVSGDFVVDDSTWHDWWRNFRAEIAHQKRGSSQGKEMICLATGELVEPAATHPLVSGLDRVGGRSQASFIGFDKDAFRSYNLVQAENGAVSVDAANAYRAALDKLVRRGEVIAGMCVAYWFSHDIEDDDNPLPWLTTASTEQSELTAEQRARDLLQSIRSGQKAYLTNSRYYALSLSGASARVMTRDWIEGAFENLVISVERWFGDLSILNYLGTNVAKEPGFGRVVTCLLPPKPQKQDEKDWLKPIGASRLALWKAALNPDVPIPFSVLGRLVPLHRAFVLTGELAKIEAGETSGAAISLLHARMGLLKAYHNRHTKGGYRMQPYLNEDHPSPAYHCGRLMSVFARLQQTALGDVGAGVVQRYYGAASTTPALVLGRLARLSKHHLNSIDSPGLAFWYETKLADIWGRLKDKIPPTLSLEEQSLFALGYYQQMAHDRAKKPSDQSSSDQDTRGETNA